MRLGVHLPVVDFGDGVMAGSDLRAYTAVARDAGFCAVSANDHLVWRRPWLDGPTTLASVLGEAGTMTLVTSLALPVVRHPVTLAKTLASLATLADGPLIAGLGPGSSAADYEAVGVPFDQRWARFDEALPLIRALLHGAEPPASTFYPAEGLRLEPLPSQPPEVWAGSWGSEDRLRRLASVADGWLASAYHTTPQRFADDRARLDAHLAAVGRDPGSFPDLVATMWLYVTDDRSRTFQVLHDVMAPLLARDPDELATVLPIGSPEHCVELLEAYAAAGAHTVLIWPVTDPIGQLEAVAERVVPQLAAHRQP